MLSRPSVTGLLLLLLLPAVRAAPVDHVPAAIVGSAVTVVTTATTTIAVEHVTVTGPCYHQPTDIVCSQEHGGQCPPVNPMPTDIVCSQEHGCLTGQKGRKKHGVSSHIKDGVCGDRIDVKLDVKPCDDGSPPICNCQQWGWECVCGPLEGKLVTVTHTATETASVTHTHTMDGGPCQTAMPTNPMPTHTKPTHPMPTHPVPTNPPAAHCPAGSSHELLHFDDFRDSYPNTVVVDPIIIPVSPFVFQDFTFDPDWAFAFCDNLQDQRNQTCNPTTLEGDYYVSLYYHLAKPYHSRVSRRITYDLEHNSTSWELLSYSLSAFPKAGGEITVLMCAWSIHDQDKDIEPSYCHAEYFTEKSILRPVTIDRLDQQLAFIEFTSYYGHYEPGSGRPEGGSSAKGLSPAEFFLDDMSVCVPLTY